MRVLPGYPASQRKEGRGLRLYVPTSVRYPRVDYTVPRVALRRTRTREEGGGGVEMAIVGIGTRQPKLPPP